jgi:hypothetical protein
MGRNHASGAESVLYTIIASERRFGTSRNLIEELSMIPFNVQSWQNPKMGT